MSTLSDVPTADEDSGKGRTPKGQTEFGRLLLGRSVKNTVTVTYLVFEHQKPDLQNLESFFEILRNSKGFQGIRVERYH